MTFIRAHLAANWEGLGSTGREEMEACFPWSGQGPLSTIFPATQWGRRCLEYACPDPSATLRVCVFPHSLPPVWVGGATLLLWEVLAAVLNVGCHLCLQSDTNQGRALLLDSSIYLANKPGYTIMGLAELLCPAGKGQDSGWEGVSSGKQP